MKNYFFLFVLLSSSFLSCKKAVVSAVAIDSKVSQHNEDLSNVKSESDNTNNDVNTLLNEVNGFKKKGDALGQSICGANIDSSKAKGTYPTLIINFDGITQCLSPARIRSGQIQIELIKGLHWSDKDAVLKITHINYKVNFPSLNNRSFTINGYKTLTNSDGFVWMDYYLKGSLSFKYKERANDMKVTFEDGSEGIWNVARDVKWTYTVATNVIAVTIDGDATSGAFKLDSWGTNRFGKKFTTKVLQPWESNSTCGGWKPTKGKYAYETDDFTADVLFGVDESGNQVSSGCASSFKVDWTILNSKSSGSVVQKYW